MKNIKYYAVFIMMFFSFSLEVFGLKDIKINNETLSPLFDKDIYVYNYYTYSDSIVIGVVKDENEKVSGYGTFSVLSGENVFIVKSEIEETIKEYKIHVFRDYVGGSDKASSLLKSLSIKGYDIDFNSGKYDYEVLIENESILDIDYETQSADASVKVSGNGNFNDSNNLIEITVTSKDEKSTSVYKINVKKSIEVFKEEIEQEPTKEFTALDRNISIISIVLVISSMLVGIFYLLFIRKIF